MYSSKNIILYFIVFIGVVEIQSLIELHEETKDLAVTEAALRKTVNGIFSTLKLDHVKHKARFGEFAVIYNFFGTITLQDDNNLEEIARLVKVDNIDNNTQRFIAQINEILNENNKSYNAEEDEYVTAHIESFITKLEYLKFKHDFDNNNAKHGINTQVLNHLRSNDITQNNTKTALEVNENGDLLESNEFWTPDVGRRIFGGYREKMSMFPFMASVQFFNKFQCGGSIIKSDLVITSASCLQLAWNNRFYRENPQFLSVQVGCYLYEGCYENIPIMEVYFHPSYDPKSLQNNLAIMRLLRKLHFRKKKKKVRKIHLDRDPNPMPWNTKDITIVGWGARSTSNIVSDVWRNRLRYAVLDFYPLKECQEVYSKEFVTQKNFCAGFFSKGGGACNRDAGGPGVAYGKLYGVISFGAPDCGAADSPTVFTKLGYYTEWIEEIMDKKVRTKKRSTTELPKQVTWDKNSFKLSTKPDLYIDPITTGVVTEALRTTVPTPHNAETLRIIKDNKQFEDFLKTMFGSEEVKEYTDQFHSDTDMETQEKVSPQNISRTFIIKPIAETFTKANIEEDTFGNSEVSKVHRGSVKMVTTIGNFEDPVLNSEEDTTIRSDTKSMITIMDERDLTEQNIDKLIHSIDIQEVLKSITETSSGEKVIKVKKPIRTKNNAKRTDMKSNKTNEIKFITDKIKPIDVMSNIHKMKSKEIKRKGDIMKSAEIQNNKDKIISKKQSTQKENKIQLTVGSVSVSVEQNYANDDYTDESDNDEGLDIYISDDTSQGRPYENARQVTLEQNDTDVIINDLFAHKEFLKLLNEVMEEVVATSKPHT